MEHDVTSRKNTLGLGEKGEYWRARNKNNIKCVDLTGLGGGKTAKKSRDQTNPKKKKTTTIPKWPKG